MQISHLFYHHEKVDELCAINSWSSISRGFQPNDEVIILDLGNTLVNQLTKTNVKFLTFEKIRTDSNQERSYTYGLNTIIPRCRNDWVILWRSDYIYTINYIKEVLKSINYSNINIVVPYEAIIGGDYCTGKWCKNNLQPLMNGNEEFIYKHGHVCPVYEYLDFPHFAIKKNMFMAIGGMNDKLWGYGYQFPDLFLRIKKLKDYSPLINFDMIAFHQTHSGSFGLGILNSEKKKELQDSNKKLLEAYGSQEKVNEFLESIHQIPLRERKNESFYKPKIRKFLLRKILRNSRVNNFIKKMITNLRPKTD